MTKQVALADRTYAKLRNERRPGESFSQAIERLLAAHAKDPLAFLEIPRPGLAQKAWLRQVEADRDATRTDA